MVVYSVREDGLKGKKYHCIHSGVKYFWILELEVTSSSQSKTQRYSLDNDEAQRIETNPHIGEAET